jgi:hypothetical protein
VVPINYLYKNNDGHYIYRMMNEMYNCDENIEVLFLGSSHVYRSYDTKLADKILGVKTFNAGSSSQGMNASYYLLREISKYHDLKTVYLDTYYGVANISDNDSSVYTIADYMKFGLNKTRLLLSNGGVSTLFDGFVSFRRNSGNCNIIQNIKSNFSDIEDYTSITYENEEYRGEGFVYSYEFADADAESTYEEFKGDLSSDMPVSELYYKSLLNIIRYCLENNIELVLINQPMPKRTTDLVVGYDNYVQFLKKIADDNDIEYWNFDLYKGDMGLTMDYYKDGAHLNGEGAEIYTKFFCNFVNEISDNGYDPEVYFYSSYQ